MAQREDSYLGKLEHCVVEIWRDYDAPFREHSDSELARIRDSLVERAKNGSSLDELLPEAYALVREVADRTLNMRPYDNQIMGAIALHEGTIIEMANGEGKTLVATMPAFLNTLAGQKVHIATYNEYLAARDARWMGPLYTRLGLSVAVITREPDVAYRLEKRNAIYDLIICSRREAYACDVTYGTYQDFVFDYLRDNSVTSEQEAVQEGLDYIILDEADNVLIDLADTPNILASALSTDLNLYEALFAVAQNLQQGQDYLLYPLQFTMRGIDHAEAMLRAVGIIVDNSLYSIENAGIAAQLLRSICSIHFYAINREYIVQNGSVIPIDIYTGRLKVGGTFSNGIHQALEAKEGVSITPENLPRATISYQYFFKLYHKMAGMTATAIERDNEFRNVYSARVVVIPPNQPIRREEFPDLIYRTDSGRTQAVLDEVKELHSIGRPVLINTLTIEKADEIGELLDKEAIPYMMLHAKYHEREAQIIAQAGRSGAVTIAAKMAGRGTDILLGGNPAGYLDAILRKHAEHVDFIFEMLLQDDADRENKEEAIEQYIANMAEGEKNRLLQPKVRECQEDYNKVVELGGLHVIGVERNQSRHLDRQLAGRAGRQGDPGSARFYISLDDDLMRRFAADRVSRIMEMVGMDEDVPLESPLVSRLIKRAQAKVESYNFEGRRQAYEFDSILDKQRQRVYAIRHKTVLHEDLSEEVEIIISNVIMRNMKKYLKDRHRPERWDTQGLGMFFCGLSRHFSMSSFAGLKNRKWDDISGWLLTGIQTAYKREKKARAWEMVQAQRRYLVDQEGHDELVKQARITNLMKPVEDSHFMQEIEEQIIRQLLDSAWEKHLRRLDELQQEMNLRTYVEENQIEWYTMKSNEAFWNMIEYVEVNFLRSILNPFGYRPRGVTYTITQIR